MTTTDRLSEDDILNNRKRLEVADVIYKARRAQGLTIRRLAKISGESAANIVRIESGARNYNIDSLLPLCRALGLSLHID